MKTAFFLTGMPTECYRNGVRLAMFDEGTEEPEIVKQTVEDLCLDDESIVTIDDLVTRLRQDHGDDVDGWMEEGYA